eukprot:scaffold3703_cov141-Pinguiococcus_pyrenoidosus.AAC.2
MGKRGRYAKYHHPALEIGEYLQGQHLMEAYVHFMDNATLRHSFGCYTFEDDQVTMDPDNVPLALPVAHRPPLRSSRPCSRAAAAAAQLAAAAAQLAVRSVRRRRLARPCAPLRPYLSRHRASHWPTSPLPDLVPKALYLRVNSP